MPQKDCSHISIRKWRPVSRIVAVIAFIIPILIASGCSAGRIARQGDHELTHPAVQWVYYPGERLSVVLGLFLWPAHGRCISISGDGNCVKIVEGPMMPERDVFRIPSFTWIHVDRHCTAIPPWRESTIRYSSRKEMILDEEWALSCETDNERNRYRLILQRLHGPAVGIILLDGPVIYPSTITGTAIRSGDILVVNADAFSVLCIDLSLVPKDSQPTTPATSPARSASSTPPIPKSAAAVRAIGG